MQRVAECFSSLAILLRVSCLSVAFMLMPVSLISLTDRSAQRLDAVEKFLSDHSREDITLAQTLNYVTSLRTHANDGPSRRPITKTLISQSKTQIGQTLGEKTPHPFCTECICAPTTSWMGELSHGQNI